MALDLLGSVAELNARVPGWLDLQVHARPTV